VTEYQVDPDRRRQAGRWKRVVLWSLLGLVVATVAVGGGSYLWFRSQVAASNERVAPEIIQALSERPSTTATIPADPSTTSTSAQTTTTPTEPPIAAPTGMNLLLLGSDRRAGEGGKGRSDTIMLVHIDSENDFLSVLSVPRDLRVSIPGHGTNKINAAYAYGGPALTIRTVQSAFGVDLDHYLEVDFDAFKTITDRLGGVYVDVDRTYDDGQIQLQPGYQLLDGTNGLRFCRHRHDSNVDFGRMERQQRYLSAIREQAMGWNLPLKLPGLIAALFDNVDTDLGANDILKLAYWGVRLAGDRIKLARLDSGTQTINGISFVVASEKKIKAAVKTFLTPPAESARADDDRPAEDPQPAVLTQADLSGVKVDVVNAGGRVGQGALAAVWLLRQGANVYQVTEAGQTVEGPGKVLCPRGRAEVAQAVALALGLSEVEETSAAARITVKIGRAYAIDGAQLAVPATGVIPKVAQWQALAAKTSFPLTAPTYVPPACSYSYQRAYSITVGDGERPAVRVGYRYSGEDQYLGFSETTWLDAPIASPGRELTAGGITYTVVGAGSECDHVWWIRDGVLHWVSNTLMGELDREQLIAVAVSAVPLP
jgi:LCP family protein required for cell wall assembly